MIKCIKSLVWNLWQIELGNSDSINTLKSRILNFTRYRENPVFVVHDLHGVKLGICFSWPMALDLAPSPGPEPHFVFIGPGPQFVFTCPGPQVVFNDPGPQFVFTDPGPKFALTGSGPKFLFTGPGQSGAWACIYQQ